MLKPSEKDLQHGLELHANSLVVESYGFSPRSAIDGAALREAIDAGASGLEVEDLYTEMLLSRVADDPTQRQEYLDAWSASGVTCVFQNAGEEGNTPLRLLKRLAHFTYLTDALRGHVSRAATARRHRSGQAPEAALPVSLGQRRPARPGVELGRR